MLDNPQYGEIVGKANTGVDSSPMTSPFTKATQHWHFDHNKGTGVDTRSLKGIWGPGAEMLLKYQQEIFIRFCP
ncbi:hypothetical protein [Pseudobacteroides cellulosolvens]|uniref:hypothetical protein n=1 Tax=Pseudobacteroides cellulosolvens TaxID=35825 RepID=UPI00055F290B|nr:hypothetical protein [Pseudobacteroides cellulosolvens]